MNRRKVKNEDVKQQTPMEDLIDLDFSGFGPETVRMDDAWSVATDKTRRTNPPPREAQPLPPVQKSMFNPTSPFQGPPAPFPQQGFVPPPPPTSMFSPPGPLPSEPVSMFGGGGIYQHPMDFSKNPYVPTNYGGYLSPPSQLQMQSMQQSMQPPSQMQQSMQQSMQPPSQLQSQLQPPSQQPQQQSSTQANFNVDYMFSGPTNTADSSLVPQSFMPPYQQPNMLQPNQSIIQQPPHIPSNQQPLIQQQSFNKSNQHLRQATPQPSYQPPFIPISPSLTAVHPQQPPSVMGQFIIDSSPPQPAADSTKTTIVPLMNPGREAPPQTTSHHQRGLSSVVRNTSVVEDNSSEDEEDYEARIESNELKTDEKVKKKVMSALQSALSDLQLTGIQIKWSDIEVDERIGVGGFAIVYHGMYRYFLLYNELIQ